MWHGCKAEVLVSIELHALFRGVAFSGAGRVVTVGIIGIRKDRRGGVPRGGLQKDGMEAKVAPDHGLRPALAQAGGGGGGGPIVHGRASGGVEDKVGGGVV